MGLRGFPDRGVVSGAEGAQGVWSHLAVFPEVFRERVAYSLGIEPSFDRYRAVWALFGRTPQDLGRVKYAEVSGTDLCVVADECQWPVGVEYDGDFVNVVNDERFGRVVGLDLIGSDQCARVPDGWCHLELDGASKESVDWPWPTVSQLCESGVSRQVIRDSVRAVAPGVLHVDSLGSVEQVGVSDSDIVGGFDLAAVSVFQQLGDDLDFTVCKCRVHVAPRTSLEGEVVGCGAKAVGKSPVLVSAATGVRRYCHAEPGTRRLDREFLQLAMDHDGLLSFHAAGVLPEVEKYLSASPASVDEFGRGYCYLQPVHSRLRWRVARLLGPNPLCADVLKIWRVALMKSFKSRVIEEIAGGWFHLVVSKDAKGVSDSAGAQLYQSLREVVKSRASPRVGADSRSVMTGFNRPGTFVVEGHVASRLQVLAEQVRYEQFDRTAFQKDVALAMKSQAMLAADDKNRLRMLAAVGDAALTLYVSQRTLRGGGTVQAYQELRSRVTRNEHLSAKFRAKQNLVAEFVCVGEVTAKIGGEALEALVGVMQVHNGNFAVAELIEWFGVFD